MIAASAGAGVADTRETTRSTKHHQPATRHLNRWIVDHLDLQPYQHVLEVGCGGGHLLEETARTLRIGFLAAVEPAAGNYQQACRRNKRFIDRQLLQIHLGQLQDLPYPPHYFHTVYSTSDILPRKHPEVQLLRLIRLLRSGGRLVLFFHPKPGAADIFSLPSLLPEYQRHILYIYFNNTPLNLPFPFISIYTRM